MLAPYVSEELESPADRVTLTGANNGDGFQHLSHYDVTSCFSVWMLNKMKSQVMSIGKIEIGFGFPSSGFQGKGLRSGFIYNDL